MNLKMFYLLNPKYFVLFFIFTLHIPYIFSSRFLCSCTFSIVNSSVSFFFSSFFLIFLYHQQLLQPRLSLLFFTLLFYCVILSPFFLIISMLSSHFHSISVHSPFILFTLFCFQPYN